MEALKVVRCFGYYMGVLLSLLFTYYLVRVWFSGGVILTECREVLVFEIPLYVAADLILLWGLKENR